MTVTPGWMARQLPVVMQQDDFTVRFLAIFEEVAGTLVHSVDTIALAADPSVTPDALVPWLGGWIGAAADPEHDQHAFRQRDWLRAQSQALSARGTRDGLERVLRELSGGHPVEIVDGGGIYREGTCPHDETGWVEVRMPLPGQATREQVEALIQAEVPIGVRVDLVILDSLDPSRLELVEEHWEPVEGGPYFWDGGKEDRYPPLRDDDPPELEPPALPGAVRRLPGTGGRAVPAGRLCRVCAEPNTFSDTHCLRCRQLLRTPPPPPVVEPEPVVEPLWDDTDWLPERSIWPIVLLVISLLIATGAVAVGLVLLA